MVSDKEKHGLFAFYKENFPRKVNSLLELGVYKGESINEFADWYPEAKIYGVDNIYEQDMIIFKPNIRFILCDQDNPLLIQSLPESLDIIIDDASHNDELTYKSFKLLYDKVAPGGLYVIEDWHPSVLPKMDAIVKRIISEYDLQETIIYRKDTNPVAASIIIKKKV